LNRARRVTGVECPMQQKMTTRPLGLGEINIEQEQGSKNNEQGNRVR
jgi:hypothetical protein